MIELPFNRLNSKSAINVHVNVVTGSNDHLLIEKNDFIAAIHGISSEK